MKNTLFSTTILFALATPVMAGEFYTAIDIGQSSSKDVCAGVLAGFSCSNTATAFRLGGGYSFFQNLGVETNIGFLGDYASERGGGGVLMTDISAPIALQIAMTGSYPLSDTYSLIGRMGIVTSKITTTTANTTVSESSTKLGYGIGGQYNISKNVAFRAQFENLGEVVGVKMTGVASVALISVGIITKF